MIKTLKITSIVAAVAAIGFVIFVGVFGLNGDADIEKVLSSPGAVEKFKKLATKDTAKQDQVSPLVKQAKAFALRINPPPPPKPKTPKITPTKKPTAKKPIPKPKTQINTKFNLVATCRYEKFPQKSMALLDMPAKGLKWYHQGEEVGHLTIEEIKDGSIVLYKAGQENSRISMPVVKTKSLLKNEDSVPEEPKVTETTILPDMLTLPESVSDAPLPFPKPEVDRRVSPSRRSRKVRPTPKQPSPDQRKKSIEDSIASIRNIMTNYKAPESSENESKAEDLKTWGQLLNSLEKDFENIQEEDNSDANLPEE